MYIRLTRVERAYVGHYPEPMPVLVNLAQADVIWPARVKEVPEAKTQINFAHNQLLVAEDLDYITQYLSHCYTTGNNPRPILT